VLLIDFWHPDLSELEIQALKAFTHLEGIYLNEKQGLAKSTIALSPRMAPTTSTPLTKLTPSTN